MTTLHAVPDDTDGPRYTGSEAAHLADVTYRCLYHWTRCGYLDGVPARVGSGNARSYTLGDVEILRLAGALVARHVHPATAFDMARTAIGTGEHSVVVGDSYTLTLACQNTTKETA